MYSWIAAARAHSYWTNWQMTLEYLEERTHSTALEGVDVACIIKITINGFLFQKHSPDQISQLTIMILQNNRSLKSENTLKMS